MRSHLLLAVALSSALPAAAQTGRIARGSHAGRAALAATDDNLGLPPATFFADSVRYVSETTVLAYGRWRWSGSKETQQTIQLPHKMQPVEALRYVRQSVQWNYGRQARYLGFDSTSQPTRPRRKLKLKAAFGSWPAVPPGQGGPALLLVALAGAGWLLAGRRSTATA